MQGTSLIEGLSSRGVARMLAWVLQDRELPLTPLLEDLAGWDHGSLEFCPGGPADAELGIRQAARLGADPRACKFRSGHLAHGPMAVCWVSLCWLPERLPVTVARALGEGTVIPLGTLLPDLARTDRRALAVAGPAVDSSAVLVAGGQPAGVACERVTPEYLAAVASSDHGHAASSRAPLERLRPAGHRALWRRLLDLRLWRRPPGGSRPQRDRPARPGLRPGQLQARARRARQPVPGVLGAGRPEDLLQPASVRVHGGAGPADHRRADRAGRPPPPGGPAGSAGRAGLVTGWPGRRRC